MREFISRKAKNIKPSGIRKFFDIVSERSDVISLGVGEPDFITPWEIRDAGIRAIKKGYTQYTSNKGLPALRREISEYLKSNYRVSFSADDMVITVGASEAIDIALRATVDDGDEVLVPDPSYVSYKPCVELNGGVAVSVPCDGDNGFKLTPEALESVITEKTKILIFPYPNNPTGGIMEREYIEKIIPIILKHDLLVISDEIYAELTYGKPHCSIASFPEMGDRVILISGFSKAFAMTGWRLGYVCGDSAVIKAVTKIHQYGIMCAPTASQYAAIEAMRNSDNDVAYMVSEYDKRRKMLVEELNRMGLHCFEPKGAFYTFPSIKATGMTSEQFCEELLKDQKVAVVPGNAFGESGEGYVRISYAYSVEAISNALEKIEKFLRKHI